MVTALEGPGTGPGGGPAGSATVQAGPNLRVAYPHPSNPRPSDEDGGLIVPSMLEFRLMVPLSDMVSRPIS